MKITRHNYEEYFILYLDNELSSADRREVELFVQQNPDLKAELDILFQSQLPVDTDVVFNGKESLLKTESATIKEDNYEEWLLSYIDNELSGAEKTMLEKFVAERPAIKKELEVLQKTKLQPENIVFGDKSILYRREEKVRIIAINWRRIAIAASLVLAVGTAAVVLFNSNEEKPADIANVENRKVVPAQQSTPATPAIREEIKDTDPTEQPLAVVPAEPIQAETANTKKSAVVDNPVKSDTRLKENNVADIINKEELAVVPEKKKSNDLTEPIYNPNVINNISKENPIAMVEPTGKTPLTNSNETSPVVAVTPATTGALYTSNTSAETFEPGDEGQNGKKNKLRGFFRKVTRTFEKNTNIKAPDDEDRLLLAGLAIKI